MREIAVALVGPRGTVRSDYVTPEVQAVVEQWAADHGDDLNARLEPFGLGNHNIVTPRFRRVITAEEAL
jgi:hypothetical protein